MTGYERVCRAIGFQRPDRIPVWRINHMPELGDVFSLDIRVQHELPSTQGKSREFLSEWGYVFRLLDNGTLGLPQAPALASWDHLESYSPPPLSPRTRFRELPEFIERSKGYYRLAMCAINGFNTYTFVRGFENALIDIYEHPTECEALLEKVFGWEMEMISLCAEKGFHGYHIGDDLGTQQTLLVSPAFWREMIMPRYRKLVAHAHSRQMHIWFHSCGNITEIVGDLHSIGVDVINISQPNVVDIEAVGNRLAGKACFLMPVSYQTTAISGTKEEIRQEAQRLYDALGNRNGGFIGYVEQYDSIGLSCDNYKHCCDAFGEISLGMLKE